MSRTPTTAAGRSLVADLERDYATSEAIDHVRSSVCAIEDEAVAADRQRIIESLTFAGVFWDGMTDDDAAFIDRIVRDVDREGEPG